MIFAKVLPKAPVPVRITPSPLCHLWPTTEPTVRRAGGQAVNKTSNAVCLVHRPTGLQVRSHKTRYLEINRRDARKLLENELDKLINGPASRESIAALRERERHRVASRKSRKKHQISSDAGASSAEKPASQIDR